jgi:hypothetical protein
MLKVILVIVLVLWLIGAIGSLVDNARWRVGMITYPEVWLLIVLLSLFAWPYYLWDTYHEERPKPSSS